MKKTSIASVTVMTVLCATGIVFGQGSLTPPGAPAPTMKTLDQVEPRTPISSTLYMISNSGSYYLTTNLTGELTIAANNVSLDLNGFSIIGTGWNAILQSGARSNLHIFNGVISAPNGNGIDFSISSASANGILENLRIYNCLIHGIVVGSGFTIRNCTVYNSDLAGIWLDGDSRVTECTVTGCGTGLKLVGTGAYVSGNILKGNADNYDFAAGNQLNLLI